MASKTIGKLSVPAEARARLKLAKDADGGNRAGAMEDLKFAAGDQWPAEIELARKLDRRPCLTINKTDTFVRSTVNNMRQQRPRIRVHPVADGADEVKAKILQGLVRHIEVNSNADYAYDLAADFQVRMGWGFIRVNSRYIGEDSFDQELYIDAVKNPFTVYFDPSSTSPDGDDAEWCLITERMKKDAFKRQYPKARPVSMADLGSGDDVAEWANNEEIVVAEYFRIEMEPEKLFMLSTGQKVFESDMPPPEFLSAAGIYPIHDRMSMRKTVVWSKITALEELEKRELTGSKRIPVFPAYGAEILESGRVERYGMVRQLKDPQRMYNFWRTQETEMVALAPKAPWVMAEGQDEGREQEWNTANQKNFSSLKYKPIADDAGNTLPPPQRQQPQAIPAASVNAAMGASEDMKAVAGMFDPALGAEGNETSGTMVQQRQQQSDLSNFHFYDNLTRTIRAVGKYIVDVIPTYYDTERVIRIIGEDNKPQVVTINEAKSVEKVLNDMTTGTYDVVMETGPGYQTKREEAFAFMMEMAKVYPEMMQFAGDLIMRQSDNPGASDIADRLAAMNPIANMGKDLPEDIDPQVKAMLMQAQAQLQKAQEQIKQLEFEKAAKVWGDEQWQKTELEKEHIRQDGENKRTGYQERSETERTHLQVGAKLHDTQTRASESWREAVLDARTDILLSKDRKPQNDTN